MNELRICIAIPTAGTVCIGFATSLAGLIAKFASDQVPSVPEAKITIALQVLESSNWITNREKLCRQIIDDGFTHLLFLDDDMTFEPQILDHLLGRRQPIVLTNYLIKREPRTDFVAVSLGGRRIATTERSRGIEPILYSGFGVSLIETRVLKAIEQPWFMPRFNAASSEYTTEDLPFFEKAREAGFTVYLDHDASKLVKHVGRSSWEWGQATPNVVPMPERKHG